MLPFLLDNKDTKSVAHSSVRACWPGASGLEIDDPFDDDEKEAFDMADGSSEESGQESEGKESGQESEEED